VQAIRYDPGLFKAPMTRLLLRFLLLAVFFNTAIGLPAHEAKHLPNLGEVVAGWQAAGDSDAPDDDGLHELCEWCHAYAQAFAPVAAGPVTSSPTPTPDRFAPPASDTLVRSARPWTFASRDPPRA
jgi:hypothetical protein